MPHRVHLEPLTLERFAPYGEVIAASPVVGRTDFTAAVETSRPHARANLATVRLAATALPVTVERMEKHAFSSQAFLPLDVARYVVIVAPDANGAPDASAAIGFVVTAGTGISYRSGVWHCGMMAIDRAGTFAILVHEDGSSDDCTFAAVEPFEVAA